MGYELGWRKGVDEMGDRCADICCEVISGSIKIQKTPSSNN